MAHCHLKLASLIRHSDEGDCKKCKQLDEYDNISAARVKLLGFSATPDRSDDLETSDIFPLRIIAATLKDLIDQGRSVRLLQYLGQYATRH